jgi:hypothetical protein
MISLDESVNTKCGTALQFLQLAHGEITGSRCLSKLSKSTGAPSVNEILESLVMGVYIEFIQTS